MTTEVVDASQTTSTFIIINLNGALRLYCIDRCWTSLVVGGSMYMHMYMGIVKGILTLEINIKYSCLAVVHICERKKFKL